MTLRSQSIAILFIAILCLPSFLSQQSCPALHPFQQDCPCTPDPAAMFESLTGWFGRKTSAYCSQQFPEVISLIT